MKASDSSVPPIYYTKAFFCAYFLYYGSYALFSSYMVSYLAQRGMNATMCGVTTSLTLLVNVLIQPVAGYIIDTFLTIKRYLILSIAAVCLLCTMNTVFAGNDLVCIILIILNAAFVYPFIQLMDAWVNCCRELDDQLVYSRVRAGGSIGFATVSVAAGYYFSTFGYGGYFLLQALCLAAILPFLYGLPDLPRGNLKSSDGERPRLGFFQSFAILLKSPQYSVCLLLFSLYWMSHRPIGSYLALITPDYGGGDRLFGNVCGIGATAEFIMLLVIARLYRRFTLRGMLLGTSLLCTIRPMLMLSCSVPLLYAGQVAQSISFAFFYSASTACFTAFSDPRIRGFSISVGLTTVNVVGTISANFIGGILFDRYGAMGNIGMSLFLSVLNIAGFLILSRVLFSQKVVRLPQ